MARNRFHPRLDPICFGEDFSLNTTSIEPLDTDPAWADFYELPEGLDRSVYSWLVVDGEPLRVAQVRRNVRSYHPILFAATEQDLHVEDEQGRVYTFSGEAIAMNPMYSWPNIGFCDSVYRWTDAKGRICYSTYQEIFYDKYVRGMRARSRPQNQPRQ